MADEWQPVVGGRCMWAYRPTIHRTVYVMAIHPTARNGCHVLACDTGQVYDVPSAALTEHPDDRRARRLLEAAREVGKTWAAMRGAKAPKLQAEAMREHAAAIKSLRALVAEIDQAEADHA